jgi:hypothetical protein
VPLTLVRPEPDGISQGGAVRARMWYWKTRSSPLCLNVGVPSHRFRLLVSHSPLNCVRKHLVNRCIVGIGAPCPWVWSRSASLQSWSAAMENIDSSRSPLSPNLLNNIVVSDGSRTTKRKRISYFTILSRSVVRSTVSWTCSGLHLSSTAIQIVSPTWQSMDGGQTSMRKREGCLQYVL